MDLESSGVKEKSGRVEEGGVEEKNTKIKSAK